MRMIEISCFKLKSKFNKLADSNEKIAELHQLFFNYFINAVEILNVLFLASDDSELSNTEMIDNNDIHIINIINLNSSYVTVNTVITISSDSSRKTSIKKMMI